MSNEHDTKSNGGPSSTNSGGTVVIALVPLIERHERTEESGKVRGYSAYAKLSSGGLSHPQTAGTVGRAPTADNQLKVSKMQGPRLRSPGEVNQLALRVGILCTFLNNRDQETFHLFSLYSAIRPLSQSSHKEPHIKYNTHAYLYTKLT